MQKHTSFFQKKMVRISVLVLTGIIVLAGVVKLTQQSGALTGALTRPELWRGTKPKPQIPQRPSTPPTRPTQPKEECIKKCERCVYTGRTNPQYCENAIRECKARCR